MRLFYKLFLRFRSLFRKSGVEQELNDELRFHLDELIGEKLAKGMTPEEGRYAALRELGGIEQIREECRDMRRVHYIENFVQDVRYGLRQLRRSPGFTAVAVFSLALGIGANTAIFTLINDLMLKTLAVRDPQQLISFGKAEGGGTLDGLGEGPLDLFSYEFYQQMQKQKDVFTDVCAFGSQRVSVWVRISGSETASTNQATGRLVSGNYFSVLGVGAALGRMIDPSDDDALGRHAVAVISYYYWQQRFSGDSAALGQSIVVNGTPFTIIGIAPSKFLGETIGPNPPDLWMPLTMQPQVTLQPSLLDPHGYYWLHLIGRLRPEASQKQAQEWVNLKFRQYLRDRQGARITPEDRHQIRQMYVELIPGGRGVSHLRSEYSQPLEVLMGVVALVLLIACANLANLLLSRSATREREISTKFALGASRSRIIRQMLAETLLLSGLGGALGLLFAYCGTRGLVSFVMTLTPGGGRSSYALLEASPDARVLGFTLGVSFASGLLFGLAPALRVSRMSLNPGLKGSSRTTTGSGIRVGGLALPKVLVSLQVALSLLLLVSAGLFVRTLRNLENQDFGFDRQNVLIVTLGLRPAGYKPEQLGALDQRLLDSLNALPGVRSATLATLPPMSGMTWGGPVSIPGYSARPHENMDTSINSVAPHYFETVGIPLLRGRFIGPEDVAASPKVAVVNQTFADHFFPRGDAVGHRFGSPGELGEREIVGVVKDAKYHDPRETPQRMIYLPLLQLSGEDLYANCLQIRTVGSPAKVTEEVRRALAGIDSNLPILNVSTLSEQVERYLGHEELISELSGFFALLALSLACIGLFGVMSYNVVRRTNEIGIRMALGAGRGNVLWAVLWESLALVVIGIAVGVPAAWGATHFVSSMLYGVTPHDSASVLGATLLMLAGALLAVYLPARRATRVDPMVALRYE
jgi:predicted permease